MAPFVVIHVALRAEALAALRAGEGLLILVDQFVNQKVLLFGEALVAVREVAAERLRAVVHMHVRLEPDIAHESLAAAWILADKLFLLCRLASALHFQADSALAGWIWALNWSSFHIGACESPLLKHLLVHTSILLRSCWIKH